MDHYIGRLLDNRYEILEVIGTGGMAVVYKARCHRLNRLVAIKILKDEHSRDEEFRRRFHHEGEAVAMLSHANTVQVYDVSSSDNADYIVMELIDGITLKHYMEKKGTLNWKETLHFGMQIAKALEHAHSRGIVHRDIKPHNVMVLKNGSVKVTDFGIARVMSKTNTLTKEALGSVHYISPEQAKGGWVDNRSDLYSLGVVMYEMMTGRPPYDGESPVAVAIQHINGGAPMPSTLNPNIPRGLEQIIMKSMALEVNDRYESATLLLQDMEEFRKNPNIVFGATKSVMDGATRVINTQEILEAPRTPRTTAEKVAGTAAGAAGAAAAAAAARARAAQQRATAYGTRTAENMRVAGSNSQTNPNAARQEAARRAAAQRMAQAQQNRRTREEIREEIREEERNRIATIAVIACSAVAVVAIIIFLIALFNGTIFNKNNATVVVPMLKGQNYEKLRDYEGLAIEVLEYRYSDTVEEGYIISQTPEANEEVAEGTVIKIIVSLGVEPEVKTMANLVGWDLSSAETYLISQGLQMNPFEEYSETVEEGKVIRTDPAEGAALEEGAIIKVYYSLGAEPKMVVFPNVVGLNYTTAYNQLLSLGFKNITYKYEESEEDQDTVIEQPYSRGTEVDVTEEIELIISKGPEIKTVAFPNLVGLNYTAAYNQLISLEFKNVTYEYKESDEEKDRVIEQPYSRGTKVDVTEQIVLTISKGPGPTTEPTTEATTVPTTAPVEEVTKTVTIDLPTDRTENYMLGLFQSGKPVIEEMEVQAGTANLALALTGSGVQYFDIYINDTYYKTVKVDFGVNG